MKHIIPLICILTIHDEETSFIEMFHYIESNPYHYQILIEQTKNITDKFTYFRLVILSINNGSDNFGSSMCKQNFARVAFVTVFFVVGSPKRLGMDLFVLKAS